VGPRVHAFWCRVPSRGNFGDALTPWLIRRLTGRMPRFAEPGDPNPKLLAAGSILAYADARSTVWGAGLMSREDRIEPAATFLAVRGPLSRARAIECGADCPPVYGDPALLLPRLHPQPGRERHGIGLVPHFSDAPRLDLRDPPPELRVIDVQSPVESFVEQVAGCEWVASSSLHGIVVAHAYGVPAVWVQFRELPSGDGSKFRDYFLSIGAGEPDPVPVAYDRIDLAALERQLVPADIRLDLEPLWDRCPVR
jgi:pyruvyltransferase